MTARRLPPFAADAVLAAALAALGVLLVRGFPALPWPAYLLVLGHTLPLAWRRRAPVPATLVAMAMAFAFVALGYPMVGLGPAGVAWLYSVGAEVDHPRSLVLLAAAESGLVLMITVGEQGDLATLFSDAVVLAVAFLLGQSARRRRDLLALHRDRADQLERTQAEVARRAVAEERLRIARELHDVVAHGMSVIAVQASTGRLTVDDDPGRTREALVVIEEASRQALDEMRRLLGVLRASGGDGDAGPEGARAPAPTLAAVDDLVARTEAAGVRVTLRVEGSPRALPAGMELAAYRILQEALTNVVRHAPGASACAVVAYRDRSLALEVTNGPARAAARLGGDGAGASAGLGLVGMRERAAVYGGTVDAGAVDGGGFRVRAELHEARP